MRTCRSDANGFMSKLTVMQRGVRAWLPFVALWLWWFVAPVGLGLAMAPR